MISDFEEIIKNITILSEEEYKKMNLFDSFGSSSFLEQLGIENYYTTTRDIDKDGNICIKCYDDRGSNTINIPINESKAGVHLAIKNFSTHLLNLDKDILRFPFVSFDSNKSVKEKYKKILDSKGEHHFIFGEYPHDVVPKTLCMDEKLIETGKKYTINNIEYSEYIDEKGFKFINYSDNKKKMNLVCVRSIEWIYDPNTDMAVTKDSLYVGVPFSIDLDYYGNFDYTNLKNFIDTTLSIEILPLKYYQLGKAIGSLNLSDRVKKICYDIIETNYFNESIEYTTDGILYDIKEKYANLTDDDYKNLVIFILKIQSMKTKNEKYIDNLINEKKEKALMKEKKDNDIVTNKLEQEYKEKQKIREYMKKEKINNLFNELIQSIPSNLSDDQLTEYIYKKVPHLTNDELKLILEIIKSKEEDINNTDTKLI